MTPRSFSEILLGSPPACPASSCGSLQGVDLIARLQTLCLAPSLIGAVSLHAAQPKPALSGFQRLPPLHLTVVWEDSAAITPEPKHKTSGYHAEDHWGSDGESGSVKPTVGMPFRSLFQAFPAIDRLFGPQGMNSSSIRWQEGSALTSDGADADAMSVEEAMRRGYVTVNVSALWGHLVLVLVLSV